VDYNGERDPAAPQLYYLFPDLRTPAFHSVYRVYQWDWQCDCRGDGFEPPNNEWPVSFAKFVVSPGEIIHVPDRLGGEISAAGHKVLVLYAEETRLTLKYTREDNILSGYTLHIEDICVAPELLALYETLDEAGRHYLPALFGRQAIGRAAGNSFGVSIRDSGYWMDPRSRKDWWYGR
jgi:hypothetical protein